MEALHTEPQLTYNTTVTVFKKLILRLPERVAYATNYQPVCIINLGHIDYQPPLNANCACSVLYFGVWAELTWRDLDLPCGLAAQYLPLLTQ